MAVSLFAPQIHPLPCNVLPWGCSPVTPSSRLPCSLTLHWICSEETGHRKLPSFLTMTLPKALAPAWWPPPLHSHHSYHHRSQQVAAAAAFCAHLGLGVQQVPAFGGAGGGGGLGHHFLVNFKQAFIKISSATSFTISSVSWFWLIYYCAPPCITRTQVFGWNFQGKIIFL